MKPRIAITLVTALLVTGCSFSVGGGGDPEESASKVAKVASDALEEKIGRAPDELSCGDGTIDIVEGKVVDCTLTDGGVTYPATVTITDVDGNDYHVTVEVGTEPIG